MSITHRTLVALAVFAALARASLAQDPPATGTPPAGDPPVPVAEPKETVVEEVALDDVTMDEEEDDDDDDEVRRPFAWFRVGSARVLGRGEFRTDFRFQKHDDDASSSVGVAYGVVEAVQFDLRLGTGDQQETILGAEQPGLFADFGLQWQFVRARRFTMSTRFDVAMSDEVSFQQGTKGADPDDLKPFSKLSVQPSVQAIWSPSCIDVFAEFGGRFSDSNQEAVDFGCGVSVPFGAVAVVGEFSHVWQDRVDLDGRTFNAAYFTPGIVFWPRERLELFLAPSFGLTHESYDWSIAASLAVHF